MKFYVIDFLPMLNFLTDPLIYGIRIREVRRAYRRLLVAALPCARRPGDHHAEQHLSTTGMTDFGARLSVVAMTTTTRTDSRSSGPARRAERSCLDAEEFSEHDE